MADLKVKSTKKKEKTTKRGAKIDVTKREKRGMSGFLKGKAKQLVPGDIFNLSL